MRAQLLLFSLKIEIGREECSKLWKMIVFSIFSRLGPFPQVFGHVQEWLMLILNKIIRAWHVVAYPIFYFVLWAKLVEKSVESYEKWWFFSVFNRLDHFAHVFRQVKECLILKLHEMVRVLHAITCTIVFFVLSPRLARRSVQTYEKYSFFSIFSRLVSFPQAFGQVKGLLMLKLHKIRYAPHIVAWPIVFRDYFMTKVGREKCSELWKMIIFWCF